MASAPARDCDVPSTSSELPSNLFAKDCNEPSSFFEVALDKMSKDEIAESLSNEIKKLDKRKQLPITSAAPESSGSDMDPKSSAHPDNPPNNLYTLKQVQLMCENMMEEQENQLRESYESALNSRLTEQYDTFVQFTKDQLRRSDEARPSYLS